MLRDFHFRDRRSDRTLTGQAGRSLSARSGGASIIGRNAVSRVRRRSHANRLAHFSGKPLKPGTYGLAGSVNPIRNAQRQARAQIGRQTPATCRSRSPGRFYTDDVVESGRWQSIQASSTVRRHAGLGRNAAPDVRPGQCAVSSWGSAPATHPCLICLTGCLTS